MPTLSGTYIGDDAKAHVELRVDIDGRHPLGAVSGDWYDKLGATTHFAGSFRATKLTSQHAGSVTEISAPAEFSWPANGAGSIRLRLTDAQPQPSAQLQLLAADGTVVGTATCRQTDTSFREVEVEQDVVEGIEGFSSYETDSLESPVAKRTFTIRSAYADAGITLSTGGTPNVVPRKDSKLDAKSSWSNAELNAAMEHHFALWDRSSGASSQQQWKVWLLHASAYDTPDYLGIMFDSEGDVQRQGAAVFYDAMTGDENRRGRAALYSCVHEIGHCFNLAHSGEKHQLHVPGKSLDDRPDALSWMNYPELYPAGVRNDGTAFWKAFPFIFDDLELMHLRHGFRENVIMGGAAMFTNGALRRMRDDGPGGPGGPGGAKWFIPPVRNQSGLAIALRGPAVVRLGQPVTVELKVMLLQHPDPDRTPVTKAIHRVLNPQNGHVRLAIRKPGGDITHYRPLMRGCSAQETVDLSPDTPARYESIYLGFGKGGFYFDQSGTYEIRATYRAPDGSTLVSNVHALRVRSPLTREDEHVAELLGGTRDHGKLIYLNGSRARHLESATRDLKEVASKYANHPLAAYARLALGIDAARRFKRFDDDGKLSSAKPEFKESVQYLLKGRRPLPASIDNITLSHAMQQLARSQKQEDGPDKAEQTLTVLARHLGAQKLKPFVLGRVANQVQRILPEFDFLAAARGRVVQPTTARARKPKPKPKPKAKPKPTAKRKPKPKRPPARTRSR
jgi:hypothetical protein